MKELSIKQKAFCEFYVASGNATESAIKAGYSENYANKRIHKMLENVGVKSYIEELMKKIEDKRIATAEEVLIELTKALRGEIEEEVVVVESVGNGITRAVKTKKQISAKDRLKAGELLGKRHMLFTDKQQIDVTPIMFVGEEDLEE